MSAVKGLRRSRVAVFGLVAGFLGCLGCESAHYVMRYPDRGVVAIPEDTPELRAKAEKLMHDQFPGGYVIDDVRPVAVGRPYHQHEEVMLYYHAGLPIPPGAPVVMVAPPPSRGVVPPGAPMVTVGPPPGPVVVQPLQPASATLPPDQLPPQPIPVKTP